MPLKSGKKAVGKNIREMVNSKTFGKGKSRKKRLQMAQAAALSKAFGPLRKAR
jgi:hypothetical protein